MNLQEILEPIGELLVWTFENLLEPVGNMPNVLFTILGFAGILIWLRWQKRYNEIAERNGTLK